eukprot:Skav226367  [mRNA]  locus=scaffold290:88108:98774:+ [translate_table: standard]
MTDLYGILGLSSSDPLGPADIRSAYRRSALQAHPDKGGSEEQFHAVLTAFEVASVPLERLRQMLAKMTRETRHEALQKLPLEANRQIKGRQSSDLDAAFALRERLLETAGGHRACSAEEAARIADAAWEAGIPARAKAEAKRLKTPKRKSVEDSAEVTLEEAAAAVSRALKAEAAAKRARGSGVKRARCMGGLHPLLRMKLSGTRPLALLILIIILVSVSFTVR